ncbi:PIN domain-containing protein [Thermococcus sp. JCM 11816]|uniref:PIN domain-containing protein n=1 Tax=Thermococcus sp. (strain JCM 11816 / KS-1) TaxID=1295125 RepID=UPI0006D1457D
MEAVIDTNVFLYAAVEEMPPRHRKAFELLHSPPSLEKWIVPTIVIYEVVWNFRKLGFSSEEARELVEQIVEDERTKLVDDRRYLIKAFETLQSLSLTHYNDSVLLTIATEVGGVLATYDKKLRKRAKKLGIKLLPEVVE